MSMNMIAQGFGVLGMALLFLSYQSNDRRKLLMIQICISICWIMHYGLLGAVSGFAVNIICFVRNLLFSKRGDNRFCSSALLPVMVIAAQMTATIMVFQGAVDIFALIGAPLHTAALWMEKPSRTRLLMAIACPLWMTYDLFCGSYIGILTETVVLCSIIIAAIRYDLFSRRTKMKNLKIILPVLCAVIIFGCGVRKPAPDTVTKEDETSAIPAPDTVIEEENNEQDMSEAANERDTPTPAEETDISGQENPPLITVIDPEGDTLETRFGTPQGYTRTEGADGSLSAFLRAYPLKEHGAPVLIYDGSAKGNSAVHAAVFELPLEAKDLQQCADAVMRVYAEYYYRTGQPDRIRFHFTNGFLCDYTTWKNGSRVSVNGNNVSWVQSEAPDPSYECFVSYMHAVFTYAGTLSMESECSRIETKDLSVGDVFLRGGSPGHVCMIVDTCRNENGDTAFLLAQSYMPAQEFHVLNNPLHPDDPWYYTSELSWPLYTPEYTFDEGSLKRPGY